MKKRRTAGISPVQNLFLPSIGDTWGIRMIKKARIATKLMSTFLLVALFMGISAQVRAEDKPEQLAQESAEAWLALVDSGKY